MGVPITFLDKYCPSQFEILDARDYTDIERLKNKSTFLVKDKDSAINGKPTYARILIKKNDSLEPVDFEIIDINPHFYSIIEQGLPKPKQLKISGRKDPYARILIKRKQ